MEVERIFSDRLCGLRQGLGLSQQKVADGLGITKVGYQNYEYGRKMPSFGNLPRLAKFFHVSSDFLLGLSDEPQLPDKETLRIAREIQKRNSAKQAEAKKADV